MFYGLAEFRDVPSSLVHFPALYSDHLISCLIKVKSCVVVSLSSKTPPAYLLMPADGVSPQQDRAVGAQF